MTANAATPAGTIIKNQASASYKDTQGVRRVTTSNMVETLIRQVAALDLTRDQKKPGVAGSVVYFVHTITNNGNGADSYTLSVNNSNANNVDFENLAIYADEDRDGQPDDATATISSTSILAPAESQNVVVGGFIPIGTANGEVGNILIQATSQFDANQSATNTDTAVVTNAAVISVTKSISALQGTSPGGPHTVTIDYRNSTAFTATNLSIIDALPAGMTYVPDSGRWSGSGTTVLTDSNATDSQEGIVYCAYSNSCEGLIEANSDTDTSSANQISAFIATVEPEGSGRLEFQVVIDGELDALQIYNTAEYEYTAGGTVAGRFNTNTIPFSVMRGAAVVVNGSSTISTDGTDEPSVLADSVFGNDIDLPECESELSDPDADGYGTENGAQCVVLDSLPGNTVYFVNTVWNAGNGIDIFDISTAASSFPAGTLVRLLQADGQTPLLDTSGNGVADTGPIIPGGSYQVVLEINIPGGVAGNNNGEYFEITTIASSVADALATDSMLNRLRNISAAAVDVTTDASVNDSLALGIGVGPEAEPVSTFSVVAGQRILIDLFVNNTGSIAIDYNLSASTLSDFSSVELPESWRVQFSTTDLSPISNTGVLAAGEFMHAQVIVTVPTSASPATLSLYVKAENEHYGASDISHIEIDVLPQATVSLMLSQEGQSPSGGSKTYTHTLENRGNVDIASITLVSTNSLGESGWSSIVYEDSDGNGALSAGDQEVQLTSLLAGERKKLFVKVLAPTTAIEGETNNTVLIAQWDGKQIDVTDVTSISTGKISVLKEQALDDGCDGVLDSVYGSDVFAVSPGNNCVSYRLTARNLGSTSIHNVVVADATPAFTTYFDRATCSSPGCVITEPAQGGQGEIVASLLRLDSGGSVVVKFMVKVD